jgi:outer membrane protein assembly factor BamA
MSAVLYSLLASTSSFGCATDNPSLCSGRTINKVFIEGLEKTNPEAIKSRISIRENTEFDLTTYEQTITELDNLRIFPSYKIDFKDVTEKELNIEITIEEGFYIFPVIIPQATNSGLDISAVLVDVNLMNEIRTGVFVYNYAAKSESHSFTVSMSDKKFLGTNYSLALTLANTSKVRSFAEDSTNLDKVLGGWSEQKKIFTPRFSYLFSNTSLEMGIELQKSVLVFDDTEKYLDREILASNSKNNFYLPENESSTFIGPTIKYGKINYSGFFGKGYIASIKYLFSNSEVNSSETINKSEASFRWKNHTSNKRQYAILARKKTTNSSHYNNQYYLDPLKDIRGAQEGIHFGREVTTLNSELRQTITNSSKFISQLNFFADYAKFTNPIRHLDLLTEEQGSDVFVIGLGGRFYYKKIRVMGIVFDVGYQVRPINTFNFRFSLNEVI